MGLKERRRVEQFKQQKFPQLEAEIVKAAGFAVPLEIDWDQLGGEGYNDEVFEQSVPAIYFVPLAKAFANVAVDDLGKQALQAGLKKVVLKNEKKAYGKSAISFEGGVLTIDHDYINVQDLDERIRIIQTLLEQKL